MYYIVVNIKELKGFVKSMVCLVLVNGIMQLPRFRRATAKQRERRKT